MEKDFGSCTHHQHSFWQLPSLNSSSFPLDLRQQNAVPAFMSPYTNTVSTNETLPVFPFPGLPHSTVSQPKEPLGWFYCYSGFHQAFKERNSAGPYKNCGDAITPNPGSGCAQRKFLVFDHSGDQTTLIFSSAPSGIGTPVQCPTSWMPKAPGANVLNREEPGTKIDTVHHFGPNLTDVYTENHGDNGESEMREDTEELDALLYSDDDDNYSENDDETSTGHSPSTMTAYDKQKWFEESVEEVASSAEQTKRRKLFDGGYDVPSLMDTASSVKTHRCYEHEDDAESSCGNEENQGLEELGFSPGNKGLRKESIRETVSILQSIIPGGKGKDAIVVLNEAIHYLKSLKRKAMALGLDTL
ncbi:transcription factor bHLH143-like [Cornus florida]|uniref:transcription factor bHLH143-like n=1 Tax=Cornus florida TaxID=4283 RepID=UPI00289E70D8|nr:transcription factor bHLH143-like [Cornus florida]XP_059631269.1 transcription factor bHLH143-like [Cornus florida]